MGVEIAWQGRPAAFALLAQIVLNRKAHSPRGRSSAASLLALGKARASGRPTSNRLDFIEREQDMSFVT